MDAIKDHLELSASVGRSDDLWWQSIRKSKAELAALEAVIELIEKPSRDEIMALVMVAEAARTGVGLDDALDKLDALKEAGR